MGDGRCPFAQWRGDGVKFGYPEGTHGRQGLPIAAIVDHIMQGTLNGTDQHFKNPATKASTHFGVGKNGTVYQWVDELDAAWGNGDVKEPSWVFMPPVGINPNLVTISIEHEGMSGDPMPDEQYKSTLKLHQYLIVKYGIAPDWQHIIGHYMINKVDKANCPGSGFPWKRLFADLNQVPAWMEEMYNKLHERGWLQDRRYPRAHPQWWELAAVMDRAVEKD